MSDNIVRHIVSFLVTLTCLFAYLAGYFSGPYGWWWTGFGVLIIYGIVYKTVDAGGHGGGHH